MSGHKPESVVGLKREIQELSALYEISQALHSSTNLEEVMNKVMETLHEKLGMERGTLTLLDSKTGALEIELAHGLEKSEIERGRYKVGEGITGKVVAAGEPIVVPNVGKEPLFLNRTKSRGDIQKKNISFICVPIKLDKGTTIGALSVDRLFQENISFEEDIRLLSIISSMVAHTVRIHLEREKEREALEKENQRLKMELKKKFSPKNIIGDSKRMVEVYSTIEMVAQSRATIMIRGESGTGKELVAHAIHYASDRADKPFIKISCAALPDTLLESELFGHEKGAFTGAAITKKGRFELAGGGTLFLDEIGDIPMSTQIKILRVLQEREFERVGGTETIRVDIRLITATNRDLEKDVREGKFREDLYYRLNVVPIFMPALRERPEDLPVLVDYFLSKSNDLNNKKVHYISREAMEQISHYEWPGNVRQLENAIERAVVLCKGDTMTPDLLPFPLEKTVQAAPSVAVGIPVRKEENKVDPEISGHEESSDLTASVESLEKEMIQKALKKSDGNQRKAAKLLGITERMLGYKIKIYELGKPS